MWRLIWQPICQILALKYSDDVGGADGLAGECGIDDIETGGSGCVVVSFALLLNFAVTPNLCFAFCCIFFGVSSRLMSQAVQAFICEALFLSENQNRTAICVNM